MNESAVEAALREAKEEIGIKLEFDRLGNVTYQKKDEQTSGRGDCYHFIFFAKPITDKQLKKIKIDNDEIVGYEWKSRAEITNLRNSLHSSLLRRICFALNGEFYSEI